MARIRKLLSLDPDVATHKKALDILESHGCSSDFVVECILKYEQSLTREDLQEAVDDLISRLSAADIWQQVQPAATRDNPDPKQEETKKTDVSRIPDSLFDIMNQGW